MDIRLGIMWSKNAVESFLILTSILPDVLCMLEIIVSSNAVLSELYVGLALHWCYPKMFFRSALCVARYGQKNLRIIL